MTKKVSAGKAIRHFREETLGISRTTLARLLRVSENSIFRWEMGKVKPDPQPVERLKRLQELCEGLRSKMESAPIIEWLERPHPSLENFRPIDLIDSEYGLRRLHQLASRIGREQGLGLPERRAIAAYRENEYPRLLEEVQSAAGFNVPIDVHWEELAHPGRAPEEFAESFTKGLFIPLIKALKAITRDELGKKALREGLHKVVIAEKSQRAMNTFEFEEGVLRISKNPAVFFKEIERHTEELKKLLESKI